MKKITNYLLALAILAGVTACGNYSGTQSEQHALTWQEQYDLGVRYLEEDNYEEAIIAFTAAIEINPKQALAYVGRGDAYVQFGETEKNLAAAQADYEMAIELNETNAEAYLGLANVYIRWENYEKALEILQEGLEKVDDNQEIADKIISIKNLQNTLGIQYPRLYSTVTHLTVLPDENQISSGIDDAIIVEVEYNFDVSSIPGYLDGQIYKATLISSYTFSYDLEQLSKELENGIKNSIDNYQEQHSKRYGTGKEIYYSGEKQYPRGNISLHTFSTNRVDKIWVLLALDINGNVLGYSLLPLPEYNSSSEKTWKDEYQIRG